MAERGKAGRPILVVEDDDDAREALLQSLETGGYPAVGANTAVEALAMLREKRVCPSLIVLDLFLPGISGWQFREEQCRDADLTSIPVILVFGYPHTLETIQRSQLRAVAAFRKPVDLSASWPSSRSTFGVHHATADSLQQHARAALSGGQHLYVTSSRRSHHRNRVGSAGSVAVFTGSAVAGRGSRIRPDSGIR